jgi:hypothetical protein
MYNVTHMGKMRNMYNIFVRRPRHRGEDNIRMDLMERWWESWNWL